MTIAEKLATITNNMQDVYDAGYGHGFSDGHIGGIDIQTVKFSDWHNGYDESTFVVIPHNLRSKPRFVALVADDIPSIVSATLPDGITATIIQSDSTFDDSRNSLYPRTYLRITAEGVVTPSSIGTDSYKDRLIAKFDGNNVYVNSGGGIYAWAPSSVSTYTMICIA